MLTHRCGVFQTGVGSVSVLRRWWVWVGVAVVVLAVGVGWALWPDSKDPPPRARQYLNYTACLLTDGKGLAGPGASAVWAGMQDVSLATHVKVQYLQVAGEETAGQRPPLLNGLIHAPWAVGFALGPAKLA